MLSSSSSSLSDIKLITTARFFSFGAGVGLVSSNRQTEDLMLATLLQCENISVNASRSISLFSFNVLVLYLFNFLVI